MTRRAALIAIATALVACPAASAIGPIPTVPFRTVANGDGSSGTSAKRQSVTIRGERRWSNLWDVLGEGGRLPEVDFSKHMLIAVTQGRQRSGGHQIRVERIERTGTGWLVKLVERAPGRGCVVTGVITNPYHVVRVPRSARRVTFERRQTRKACTLARLQSRNGAGPSTPELSSSVERATVRTHS